MSQFRLIILTPEKELYNAEIERVLVPTDRGSLTILYQNYPLITLLVTGIIKVIPVKEKPIYYAISQGVMQNERDIVYILGSAIERSDQIDVARALAAKERAEELIKRKHTDKNIDVQRAEAALNRALNRLKAASLNN
ncbi:MAG: ATP synthase F1 subunit epsilon [Syntrophomonadaceae bacterium]|jgi:F-type H+-transporting ATPase subunit epsilon